MYVSVQRYSFLTGLYCGSVSTVKQKHAQSSLLGRNYFTAGVSAKKVKQEMHLLRFCD